MKSVMKNVLVIEKREGVCVKDNATLPSTRAISVQKGNT